MLRGRPAVPRPYSQEILNLRNENRPSQLPRPPAQSAPNQTLPAVPAITYRGASGTATLESGLLPSENRLDVGWEISLGFENLAVLPDQRFPVAAQLAHVRSVHLVQDRVQVNAVGQCSPVRDIDDVGQRVGNSDQIATFRGSDELANFFLEQFT